MGWTNERSGFESQKGEESAAFHIIQTGSGAHLTPPIQWLKQLAVSNVNLNIKVVNFLFMTVVVYGSYLNM
jgi:hypothetical protein